jgi:hypothetical protein
LQLFNILPLNLVSGNVEFSRKNDRQLTMAMAFTSISHEKLNVQLLGDERSFAMLPERTMSPSTTTKKLKASIKQHWKEQIQYLSSSQFHSLLLLYAEQYYCIEKDVLLCEWHCLPNNNDHLL